MEAIEDLCRDLKSITVYQAGPHQIPRNLASNQYERYLLKLLDRKVIEDIFYPFSGGYLRSVNPTQESIDSYLNFILATGEDFKVQKNMPYLFSELSGERANVEGRVHLINLNTLDNYVNAVVETVGR